LFSFRIGHGSGGLGVSDDGANLADGSAKGQRVKGHPRPRQALRLPLRRSQKGTETGLRST
jgi:hypothetical protein